jgi:hypothetical protein
MPIVLASLGESRFVRSLPSGIEHPHSLTVSRYGFSLQISDMSGEWRRTESTPLMANNARFPDHPALRAEEPGEAESDAATPEGRASRVRPLWLSLTVR